MERYIKDILANPDRFISNYIADGRVDNLEGMNKINGYVYDIYPFLSIEYLLRAHGEEESLNAFRQKFKAELSQDEINLTESIGCNLRDNAEIQRLSMKIKQLEQSNQTLQHTLQEAHKENERLRQMLKEANSTKQLMGCKSITYLFCHFFKSPYYCSLDALVAQNTMDYEGFVQAIYTEFGLKIVSNDLLKCDNLKDVINYITNLQGGVPTETDDEKKLDEIRKKYNHSTQYALDLTERHLTDIIIGCSPKTVFGTDSVYKVGLDIDKLKEALTGFGYKLNLSQVPHSDRGDVTIKSLKQYILSQATASHNKIQQKTAKTGQETSNIVAIGTILANQAIEPIEKAIFVNGKNKKQRLADLMKGMGVDDIEL